MPAGPRVLLDNVCYHIITRGNQKQKVFRDALDHQEYLNRLRKYKKRYDFSLYAYCLMPNHIHMLGQIQDTSGLPHFMSSLLRSYTAYFNNKYDKVGHLWQGRFKTKIILKDRYLIDCINYIEQNAVRANLVQVANPDPFEGVRRANLGTRVECGLNDTFEFQPAVVSSSLDHDRLFAERDRQHAVPTEVLGKFLKGLVASPRSADYARHNNLLV